MRYAKWMFVVASCSMLMSFIGKDKSTQGLNVGDTAPDFCISSPYSSHPVTDLSRMKGRHVLLSFWASYDAQSRLMNAALCQTVSSALSDKLSVVSVSFDEYRSVFQETVRMDGIDTPACFVETAGEASGLFRKYRLERGFANYLLDERGVIVAKNISASDLPLYLEKKSAQ